KKLRIENWRNSYAIYRNWETNRLRSAMNQVLGEEARKLLATSTNFFTRRAHRKIRKEKSANLIKIEYSDFFPI
ncbi:MAG TPA: hypothetical protein VGA09_08940, partial [Candidatus Binatia bacterium]